MACATRQKKWELFEQGLKFCRGCERTLSVSGFSTDSHRRDGLTNRCRRCTNKTTISPDWPCTRCGCPRSKGGAGVCRACYQVQAKEKQEARERFEPERILRRNIANARQAKNKSFKRVAKARVLSREAKENLRLSIKDFKTTQKQIKHAERELTNYQRQQSKLHQRADRAQAFKYNALHDAVRYDAPISHDIERSMLTLLSSDTATPLDVLLEQEALTIIVTRLMREKGLNEVEAIELVRGFV